MKLKTNTVIDLTTITTYGSFKLVQQFNHFNTKGIAMTSMANFYWVFLSTLNLASEDAVSSISTLREGN